MPDKWLNIAGFYWRKEFAHNGMPVYAEVSSELAENETDAEDLFLQFTKTKLPEACFEFKDSCSYDLELGGRLLKITCFKSRSKSGAVISCGIRIRPEIKKSPA